MLTRLNITRKYTSAIKKNGHIAFIQGFLNRLISEFYGLYLTNYPSQPQDLYGLFLFL